MIQFRNASAADLDLTFQIKKTSIKSYIEHIWGWSEEVQLAFHAKDFEPEQIKILIDEQGHDIGLLVVTEDDTSICVTNILLCDHAQGKGIGTAVLSELIEQARSKTKRIELQVFKVNERARTLYEKLGFGIVGQSKHHYQLAIKV